jgi:hypothetical protein
MKKIVLMAAAGALALSGCGGEDGNNSGGGTGAGTGAAPPAKGSTSVVVRNIRIQPSDVLATTKLSTNLSYKIFDYVNSGLNGLHDLIAPPAHAQFAPPIKLSSQQEITRQLVSGNLIPISVTYATVSGDAIICDLNTAEILVKDIWVINEKTNDLLANMSFLSSFDENCNGAYTSGTYVISGSSGKVFKVDQNIAGLSDIIPANDPAFNTSDSALLLLAGGQVLELKVSSDLVTITQLTTDSLRLLSRGGLNVIAYDGTYLVGVADSPGNPIIVYKKGDVSFGIFRPNTNSYPGIFINPEGKFVWNDVHTMSVLDPVSLTVSPYEPSRQPSNMYGARGRYASWLMSDRCMLWNTANGDWINLYFYPKFANVDPWGPDAPTIRLDYSRLSGKYAFCVDHTFSSFVRYDIEESTGVGVDLSSIGIVSSGYEIFEDFAFAKITKAASSNVEYVQIDFSTGEVKNLGVITSGSRTVVNLVPIG